MGVHGLWRLLDASGKAVPLETLEGKVLAIDVSIWIHQVLQGYQDRRGSSIPNAHLLGLYHRICKLLYFKIKPVFVFDGGVPMLKKNTIASRKKQKAIAAAKAQQMKSDLIHNLIKHTAVTGVLGGGEKDSSGQASASTSKNQNAMDNMFKLPDIPSLNSSQSEEPTDDYEDYDSDDSVESSPRKQSRWVGNIHNVDVACADFKALPADVRYNILTDLKETRKQNSWGRLHEMPGESRQFSDYQMKRLLKRRMVQESLETAEKEMGGKSLTLEELEKLLTDEGICIKGRDEAFRIASDSTTRVIYFNDPQSLPSSSSTEEPATTQNSSQDSKPGEQSVSRDSGHDDTSFMTAPSESVIENINEYAFDSDWESEDEDYMSHLKNVESSPKKTKSFFSKQHLNPAVAYMLEYAGLPQEEIFALIQDDKKASRGKDTTDSKENNERKTADEIIVSLLSPEEKSINDTDENNRPSSSKMFDANETIDLTELSDTSVVDKSSKQEASREDSGFKPSDTDNSASATKLMSSDSDTDSDLVEIQDVPIPDSNFGLEILVKSDEAIKEEDDIFADVFMKEPTESSDVSAQDISSSLDSSANPSLRDVYELPSVTNETESASLTLLPKPDDKPIIPIASPADVAEPKDAIPAATGFVDSVAENSESAGLVTKDSISAGSAAKDSASTDSAPRDSVLVDSLPKITVSADPEQVESVHHPKPSSSRANDLSDQVAKFKPELLKASQEKLVSMQAELENEHSELTENIGRLERQATAVTDEMRMEAEHLLRLFGIPYIVAPMEAEAQCAYLESIELTDGTVTDDSDIWLFGGRCVYKNFFNNNKRVMQYQLSDIQHHFKLSRQQMIQLALLVGSDYTVGVSGIGPVTALEVLAAFPSEGDNLLNGLTKFRSWIGSGRSPSPGRTALRSKLRNIEIDRGFPSQAVVQAYLFPTVDESKEAFSWNKPNLKLLRDYTRQKFGWTQLKFEETMGPVVKKLAESRMQKDLTSYFRVDTVPKSIETNLSKRVKKAVEILGKGIAAGESNEGDNLEEQETSGSAKVPKRRRGKGTSKDQEITSGFFTPVEGESLSAVEARAVGSDAAGPAETSVAKGSKAGTSAPRNGKNVDEYIPQREKDKANALKKKLKAIEVFRKSKKGPGRTKKAKRVVQNIKKEANLSESSDSS